MRLGIAAFVAFFLGGCDVPEPSQEQSAAMEEIRQFIAVPVQDRFARATAIGDRRLLGVYGFTLTVPGSLENDLAAQQTHGVLGIPGTSDAISSDLQLELNARAYRYAEQYNALLLSED